MEIFGPNWENHIHKIENGWNGTVGSKDWVIIAGDISWATTMEQARPDFEFIESLPGKKIVTIGNHDFWFQTATKSNNFFFENYRTIVPLIRNDYINIYDDIAICAVKGYMNETHPEFKQEYEKGYSRECMRLENTLKIIPTTFSTKIVASHYPPIHDGYSSENNRIYNIMQRYGVDKCIYGHLHAEAVSGAYIGVSGCTDFMFVAGDSHNFEPLYVRDI